MNTTKTAAPPDMRQIYRHEIKTLKAQINKTHRESLRVAKSHDREIARITRLKKKNEKATTKRIQAMCKRLLILEGRLA